MKSEIRINRILILKIGMGNSKAKVGVAIQTDK